MTIKVLGDAPKIARQVTGLYSFDRAFTNGKGEIGFPIGVGTEIFGATHIGKSTLTYGLAGLIANAQSKNIALADFEGFDPDFLVSVLETVKFNGNVQYLRSKGDEETLDSLLTQLYEDEYSVGILDSVGSISPVSEVEGDLGDANMGRRAFLMAQFSRAAMRLLHFNPSKTIFIINHYYPKIGGRGGDTPGGEVKDFLLSVRIHVKRKFLKGKYVEYPDGSYIIEGTVEKNRWGFKDRTFNLFILAGKGLHLGLTAMYDCVMLKKATAEKSIKIGDKSFGYMKDIVEQAQQGNDAFFMPFFEALNTYNNEETTSSNGDENDRDTSSEQKDEGIHELDS
jgi:RecA/RadA recombinase